MAVDLPRRSHHQPQRLEMFSEMAKRIPRRSPEVAAALDQCVESYGALIALKDRLARDATKTDGGKLVRLANATKSSVIPKIETLDNAFRQMEEGMADMRKQIRETYDPPNKPHEQVSRLWELRDFFQRIDPGKVLQILEKARNTGNEEILMAVASGQDFVSNIPEGMHQHTRDFITDAKLPGHREILKGFQEQKELATLFRSEMLQSISDMVDLARADEIAAAAREDVSSAG